MSKQIVQFEEQGASDIRCKVCDQCVDTTDSYYTINGNPICEECRNEVDRILDMCGFTCRWGNEPMKEELEAEAPEVHKGG